MKFVMAKIGHDKLINRIFCEKKLGLDYEINFSNLKLYDPFSNVKK
jgi:hypothetical protein